jgi:hypothetical protein
VGYPKKKFSAKPAMKNSHERGQVVATVAIANANIAVILLPPSMGFK